MASEAAGIKTLTTPEGRAWSAFRCAEALRHAGDWRYAAATGVRAKSSPACDPLMMHDPAFEPANWKETCVTKGEAIDPEVVPSGTGCVECLAADGWWLHLRRCTACGHIGCCDSSPGQHATKHAHGTGHPVIASFEPGEDWFYDYRTKGMVAGEPLAAPHAHPASQPVPGPAGKVPRNWQTMLH